MTQVSTVRKLLITRLRASGGTVDADSLTSRLAAGLVRVAVTTQTDTVAPGEAAEDRAHRRPAADAAPAGPARRDLPAHRTGQPARHDRAHGGVHQRRARPGGPGADAASARRTRPTRCVSSSPRRAGRPSPTWRTGPTPCSARWRTSTRRPRRRCSNLVTDQIAALQRAGRIPVTRICLTCRYFDGYAHPGTNLPHHCHYVDARSGTASCDCGAPNKSTDELVRLGVGAAAAA